METGNCSSESLSSGKCEDNPINHFIPAILDLKPGKMQHCDGSAFHEDSMKLKSDLLRHFLDEYQINYVYFHFDKLFFLCCS